MSPGLSRLALSSLPDCSKIKLRTAAYRLVYRLDDDRIAAVVIADGKRNRETV